MERIKDLSKVIVRGDMLFCELFQKRRSSGLILPDAATGNDISHMEVLAKGHAVVDVEVGDTVLLADGKINSYPLKGKDYTLIPRNMCTLIVKPDNVDLV